MLTRASSFQRAVRSSSSTACRLSSNHQSPSLPTTGTASFDFERIRQEIIQNWLDSEASSPSGTQTKARYCTFTYFDGVRAYQDPKATWHWLDRELSSNLAGETGAVAIYQGALTALTRIRTDVPRDAVDFCHEHMGNEAGHLRLFESVVSTQYNKHTRLLPLWRLAGWTLGFVPTVLGGSRALYVTVQAVETFVEEHFQGQIGPLQKKGSAPELVKLLQHCCEDEVHHREDAASRLLNEHDGGTASLKACWWVQPWSKIVQTGSAFAAEVARRI